MGATSQGTRSYFVNHENRLKPVLLGTTDWQASPIGFGGYRISEHDPEHRESLRKALLSGINLLDTSSNYTDGSSERLIGEVLAELISLGKISREQVIVVTKVGYLQGHNLKLAKDRAREKRPFPEMVEYQADCWHNISPLFIEEQITQSLERLKLEQIDVLLLHNPEYFFKTLNNRELYYSRIKHAFEHLETEVSKKRIQYYGISSNAFPDPENAAEYTSLMRVFEIAKSIRKNHHFAFIQFPFNLYEAGAALHGNNAGQTVFEFAKLHKIATLANRPFNASNRNRLTRLISFPNHDEIEIKGELHKTVGRVVEHEKKFPLDKLPQGLQWGHILRENLTVLDDVIAWRETLTQQVIPTLRASLERIEHSSPDRVIWAQEYREMVGLLLDLFTKNLETLAAKKSAILSNQLDTAVEDLKSSMTLSQKALRIYRSIPGLDVTLIGMRQSTYVDDAIAVSPMISNAQAMKVVTLLQRHR